MTSLVPEVVDARRIGKDVEQLAIMLSQGALKRVLPTEEAHDSTRFPIRFFVEGCHPESETQQATSPGFQTWITKEWCHHGTQLELSTLDFHIISDSGDGLL